MWVLFVSKTSIIPIIDQTNKERGKASHALIVKGSKTIARKYPLKENYCGTVFDAEYRFRIRVRIETSINEQCGKGI